MTCRGHTVDMAAAPGMTMKRTQAGTKSADSYVDWQAFSARVASLADIIEVSL